MTIRGGRKMSGEKKVENTELVKKLEEIGFADWENFGEYTLNTVLDYIDYWAWNIAPDSPLESYSNYNNIDLYEATMSFEHKFSDIEIELLRNMPEEVYEKINAEYHRKLEIVISELEKEYREYCLTQCEFKDSETCENCEFHYLIE
jgi:hypothetical protein